MSETKKGVTIAGNIITDIIKTIDRYPQKGMLANVLDTKKSVGGCVPNTAINLAKIDKTLPVSTVGRVGNDENGKYIISQLEKYGINCKKIKVSERSPTSCTDVMSVACGERTFFCTKGADGNFSPGDIEISLLDCKILHIGYIFLLDLFDAADKEYGTAMARFLHDVQKAGIKTSIDMVSDSNGDYAGKVLPVLPYCNYVIINEVDSSAISGIPAYDSFGRIRNGSIEKTMKFIASKGVNNKVIVHSKDAGFCYDIKTEDFSVIASLDIPAGEIKGSVGAGDAFCAASLYGIYHDFDDKHILEFASSAAACSLFSENSVDGMLDNNGIEKISQKFGRKLL